MNIGNAYISAFRSLNRNRMRSALTSFGVIIGVSSVIVMVGIGSSARMVVKDKVTNFGANAIRIMINEGVSSRLTVRDIERLQQNIPQIKYITPFTPRKGAMLKYSNRHLLSMINAVDVDFFKLKDWPLASGRFFTRDEVRAEQKFVVIGETVRRTLFNNEEALDRIILIDNNPFMVVGCLAEMGQGLSGSDFDNVVLMPFTTAANKIFGKKDFGEVHIATQDEKEVNSVRDSIRYHLRMSRNIMGEKEDFSVKTSAEQLRITEFISQALSLLLAGVSSISLFVGGVGIMNIMLVSVNERIREIGIRMAIGAKRRDILFQFLIESVSLSALGGIIGITIGLVGYALITHFADWPFIFSILSVFVSFLFSCFVGIFFGYYPARKAANLKPIEALRYE